MTASSSSQTVSPTSIRSYPFANAVGQIEVLPNGIDVEEESRLYDQLDHVRSLPTMTLRTFLMHVLPRTQTGVLNRPLKRQDTARRRSRLLSCPESLFGWATAPVRVNHSHGMSRLAAGRTWGIRMRSARTLVCCESLDLIMLGTDLGMVQCMIV